MAAYKVIRPTTADIAHPVPPHPYPHQLACKHMGPSDKMSNMLPSGNVIKFPRGDPTVNGGTWVKYPKLYMSRELGTAGLHERAHNSVRAFRSPHTDAIIYQVANYIGPQKRRWLESAGQKPWL